MRQIPAAIAISPAPITNDGLLERIPFAKTKEDDSNKTDDVISKIDITCLVNEKSYKYYRCAHRCSNQRYL